MKIDATAKTPQVEYFESTGILEISGKSIPENTIKFYQTISDWLTSFSTNHANKKIELIFKLEYFNTSSAKKITKKASSPQHSYVVSPRITDQYVRPTPKK